MGVSTLAGTYSYANETPNIVYELLLGGILTATLVPLFVKYYEVRDDDAPSAIITVAIAVLRGDHRRSASLAAPWIIQLYTLNVHGGNVGRNNSELATDLLRCSCRRCSSTASSTLATAMLNARRRFAAAAFAPVLNNVVVIAVFLALPRIADGSLTVRRARRRRCSSCSSASAPPPASWSMALVLLPPLTPRTPALRVPLRLAPSRRAHDAAALGLDRRLRHREPDRAPRRSRARLRHRRRTVLVPAARTRSSSSRTACSRCRS